MVEDPVITRARVIGERRAAEIADYVDASGPQRKTIAKIERLVRHGGSAIDLRIRRHGRDHMFEADWLKQLFKEP